MFHYLKKKIKKVHEVTNCDLIFYTKNPSKKTLDEKFKNP